MRFKRNHINMNLFSIVSHIPLVHLKYVIIYIIFKTKQTNKQTEEHEHKKKENFSFLYLLKNKHFLLLKNFHNNYT
jgi:fucose permease